MRLITISKNDSIATLKIEVQEAHRPFGNLGKKNDQKRLKYIHYSLKLYLIAHPLQIEDGQDVSLIYGKVSWTRGVVRNFHVILFPFYVTVIRYTTVKKTRQGVPKNYFHDKSCKHWALWC
ncbi:hypothetical protein HOLleu_01928 [Holothuria leucospilota]|uniref:Uncharacterized protein n=1 Tax=Holothuria leucospilota TaxID=206669 RepID=A0A9Q1CQK0_HOLLE|nr:hypothetical protein HOLleu_01928 [Holothuria leucospilota]